MEGFVKRIRKSMDIDKVVIVKRGIYLVKFYNIQDQISIVQRGLYFFDDKPFIVKVWTLKMDINVEPLKSFPIWFNS